jgi:hypothetical protein
MLSDHCSIRARYSGRLIAANLLYQLLQIREPLAQLWTTYLRTFVSLPCKSATVAIVSASPHFTVTFLLPARGLFLAH